MMNTQHAANSTAHDRPLLTLFRFPFDGGQRNAGGRQFDQTEQEPFYRGSFVGLNWQFDRHVRRMGAHMLNKRARYGRIAFDHVCRPRQYRQV